MVEPKVTLRGVRVGYDELSIALMKNVSDSMFVSVYRQIVPLHKAVAIAININQPYTIETMHGPLPWPIKSSLPVDTAFVQQLQVVIPQRNTSSKKDAKDFSFRY